MGNNRIPGLIGEYNKIRINILYEDDYLLAIDKPHSLLVHRTGISEDKFFLLQILRNQIGQYLYPLHRLDRATSGVLLFAKSYEAASALNQIFRSRGEEKHYLAIVRGWMDITGTINYPLNDIETGVMEPVEAVTEYHCLDQSEKDYNIGLRYQTARFSLLKLKPITGRRQQIRKHLSHLRHPIIGDRRHGDVKHNNYFRDSLGINRMLLHAIKLSIHHPFLNKNLSILCYPDGEFMVALDKCGLMMPDTI